MENALLAADDKKAVPDIHKMAFHTAVGINQSVERGYARTFRIRVVFRSSIPGNIVRKDITPGLYKWKHKFIIVRILPFVRIYEDKVVFLSDSVFHPLPFQRKQLNRIAEENLDKFPHPGSLKPLFDDIVQFPVYLDGIGIHAIASLYGSCGRTDSICQAGKGITGESPYFKHSLAIVPHCKIAEIQAFLLPHQHLGVIGAGVSLPLYPV